MSSIIKNKKKLQINAAQLKFKVRINSFLRIELYIHSPFN